MLVRLAIEDDFEDIVRMAEHNIVSTCPHMGFDRMQAFDTLYEYLEKAEPTIFVAEHRRKLVGFLLASIVGYRASSGHKTVCEVLYVDPEYRGTRAAPALLKHMIDWSQRLGAKEIAGGVDNGFQPERTSRFLEHFGFENVGFAMRRIL